MRKTVMLVVCAVSSIAFGGVNAFAATNSYAPLHVQVQTKVPDLKPLQEQSVPTFADGLAQLQTNFVQDSQQFSGIVPDGSGGSFSFSSAAADPTQGSSVFAGLVQQLPTMKALKPGTLPNVQKGFAADQKTNEAAFGKALSTDPLTPVPLSSIAPSVPNLSSLTGGQASAVAGFISSHIPQVGPTGHKGLKSTAPDGWQQSYAAGTKAYTEAGTFSGMKDPAGFGTGLGHNATSVWNSVKGLMKQPGQGSTTVASAKAGFGPSGGSSSDPLPSAQNLFGK